jgi:hypothetical protein
VSGDPAKRPAKVIPGGKSPSPNRPRVLRKGVSLTLPGAPPKRTDWTISLVCRKALGSDVPLKLSIVLQLSESPRKLKHFMGQWKRVVPKRAASDRIPASLAASPRKQLARSSAMGCASGYGRSATN